MDKSQLMGILMLMDQAEEYKPIARKIIDILKSYGPEIGELRDMTINAIAHSKGKMFKALLDEGFTREEAIQLMIAQSKQMKEATQNYQNQRRMKSEN